jgi:hypothetical protein
MYRTKQRSEKGNEMNNLGREKLWTSEIWAEIDKAVMTEVDGYVRIALKVFPAC